MMWLNLKFNEIADTYVHWLWHGAWQGAVVAIVVLAVLKLFPRIPLSVQYWLLVLALVKFMIPPMIASPSGLFSMLLVPSNEVDVRTFNAPASNLVSGWRPLPTNSSGSETAIPPLMQSAPDVSGENSQDAMPMPVPVDLKTVIEQSQGYSPTVFPIAGAPRTTWQRIMLLELHILGSVMFLAWIAVQMIRLHRVVIGSRGIRLSDLGKSIPFSEHTLRNFDGIRLRCSDRVNGPMAFGILSPTILTPTVVLSGESQLLESVLLHEVAHIRHKDLWMRWLEVAIQTVWWFHPFVWLLCRKISAVREDICDDFVIANGTAREDQYCQTLITIAAQSPQPVGSLLACGITDSHPLARRIKRLMNQERLRARPLGIMAMTLVFIAALVLLPGVRSQRLAQAQAAGQSVPECATQDRESLLAVPQSTSSIAVPSGGLKLETRAGRLELHRISAQGIVRNLDGKPVPGATVIIGSARSTTINGTDEHGNKYSFKGELARTTSDSEGRYEFKDLPAPCFETPKDESLQEPLNARLQIVSFADGYGLAWCHSFRYRPQTAVPTERTMEGSLGRQSNSPDAVYFADEPINIDLTLSKQVPLHGRLTDEDNRPLAGVAIRLGHILQPSDPIDGESTLMAYHFMHGWPVADVGMLDCTILPTELTRATTDAQGQYRFEHVPLGTQIMIGFTHPKLKRPVPNVIQLKETSTNEIEVDSSGLYSPKFFAKQNPSTIDVPNDGLKLKTNLGRLELHRISMHGVVRNEAGEAVSSASVIIGIPKFGETKGTDNQGRSYSFKGELARTTTDKDGRYEFKDLVVPCREPDKDFPYPEPLNAKLQIVAIAQDYGLTWSYVFRYRPDIEVDSEASRVKPNVAVNEDFGHVFFHGQDIDVPVTIVKGVTLHGKVADAKGSPISDVVVRLGRVLMPEDGIDAEPRMTIFRFLESPFQELGHTPCDIIPLEFRQAKTDSQGQYKLEHVPMKARAGVSFSHPRFPANQFYEISSSGDLTAKHDIASGQPLDVVAKTMNQVQLSVIDGSSTKLPGSHFEIVSGAGDTSTQQSSIATADASGIAMLGLSEGHYSIRISPPSDKKIWSSIFKLDVSDEPKSRDISYSLDSAQSIRIKATSFQDGEGIKDIAFEYCRDQNPDEKSIWQPVATQGVTSEFVRTDSSGKLDAMFPVSYLSIRVAGEQTRSMLRYDRRILITDPAVTEIEFIFAKRPESKPDLDARSAKLSRGQYRYRTHNHLQKSGATLPQIEELVASMRTMAPKDALGKLQAFFDNDRLSETTLIQDGPRRIVTDERASGSPSIAVEDGLHSIRFEPANRQCDVSFSKDSRVYTQSIHRILVTPLSALKDEDGQPRFPLAPLVQDGQNFVRKLAKSEGALIEILAPDQQFVLEQRSIQEKTEKLPKKRTDVDWQLFPREIDGLMLPTVVIKTKFEDEVLDRLEVVFFDEMKLLDKVPGDAFALSVPAGTTIFDYRLNPNDHSSPSTQTLRFATFDVAAVLKPAATWSLLDSKPDE